MSLKAQQYRNTILSIVVLIIIFAFVLGVLVYVGGALLQTLNFASIPEPKTSPEAAIVGGVIGIIFGLIQKNKNNSRDV
jgi:hypothetical protein